MKTSMTKRLVDILEKNGIEEFHVHRNRFYEPPKDKKPIKTHSISGTDKAGNRLNLNVMSDETIEASLTSVTTLKV